MQLSTRTGALEAVKTQCLILGVFTQRKLDVIGQQLDQASSGALNRALRHSDVDGNAGTSQLLTRVDAIAAERIMLIGLGETKKFDSRQFATALEAATRQLNAGYTTDAVVVMPAAFDNKSDLYRAVRDGAIAAEQAVYRFDELKTKAEPPKRPLKRLAFWLGDGKLKRSADKALGHGQAVANGMALAKNLANRPGNVCTPTHLAEEARKLGKRSPALKVTVLEEKAMEKLGMGALLSVSRGSREPAKLIVMDYKGGKPTDKPVVLVGKGLTFDAGGISIKPAANMDEMKYDMCGGASVFGTIAACVELELPINVVGVVPSSENLPDGDGQQTRRHRHQHVRADHRGAEHRRRRPPDPVRRPDLHRTLQTGRGDRHRHPDRGLRGRPRSRGLGADVERRQAGRGGAGRRRANRRPRLAPAALGQLPASARQQLRRYGQYRRIARPAPLPQPVSCRATPRRSNGRISTSPARPGRAARRKGQPADRYRCSASS